MNGESCLQEDHDKKDKVLKSNREEESYLFKLSNSGWFLKKSNQTLAHFFVGEEMGEELGVLRGSNRGNHPTAPNISQS